jgi:hypothetical protein
MYFEHKVTEEDDLAGISALMAAIPDKLFAKKKPAKPKKKSKTTRTKYKARPKKRGKRT